MITKILLIISIFAPAASFAQQSAAVMNRPSVTGGTATLYALDPLSRTICLNDGKPGGVFQGNQVRNRCSDIDFNAYNPGSFTVGVEGGRLGVIIDLGTADTLMRKYGYQETVGKGQGFASLRLKDGKIVILKDYQAGTVQELQEGALLLGEAKSGAKAAVEVGHIYLVRLTDRHDKQFSLMAKLIVIDYRPRESVTIRWEPL